MTDVLVLCYHAVSLRWDAELSVTPDELERQLSLLISRGWQGATFTDAVLEAKAHRTLAVTFDDAFASVHSLAEPILSSLGLPATVFAPTAFMSRRQTLEWDGIERWGDTSAAAELTGMNWLDLAELIDRGWEVGSHTRTHPHLTRMDEHALRRELEVSREECQEGLGRPCQAIAYPYGDVDARVVERARSAGYLAGAALSSSLRSMGALRWPRVGIYHVDRRPRFELKINPVIRRWRASQLWPKGA